MRLAISSWVMMCRVSMARRELFKSSMSSDIANPFTARHLRAILAGTAKILAPSEGQGLS